MPRLSTSVRQQARDAEDSFEEWAQHKGWEVLRNGWPDFLCVDRKGRIICVEAKSGNANVTKAQREVLAILVAAGLACYIWTEKAGLMPRREQRRGVKAGWPPDEPCIDPPYELPRRLWEVATGTRNL